MLKTLGNVSCLRAKPAHFVGHLPAQQQADSEAEEKYEPEKSHCEASTGEIADRTPRHKTQRHLIANHTLHCAILPSALVGNALWCCPRERNGIQTVIVRTHVHDLIDHRREEVMKPPVW